MIILHTVAPKRVTQSWTKGDCVSILQMARLRPKESGKSLKIMQKSGTKWLIKIYAFTDTELALPSLVAWSNHFAQINRAIRKMLSTFGEFEPFLKGKGNG